MSVMNLVDYHKPKWVSQYEIDMIKKDATEKAMQEIANILAPIVMKSLKGSYNWFKSEKYGDNRVNRVLQVLNEELNKIGNGT